jgi:hypothetical protein
MGKKIFLLITSAVITLFFLAVSIYQLTQAFTGYLSGNTSTNTLIAGWISLILGALGLCCILIIRKSNPTQI